MSLSLFFFFFIFWNAHVMHFACRDGNKLSPDLYKMPVLKNWQAGQQPWKDQHRNKIKWMPETLNSEIYAKNPSLLLHVSCPPVIFPLLVHFACICYCMWVEDCMGFICPVPTSADTPGSPMDCGWSIVVKVPANRNETIRCLCVSEKVHYIRRSLFGMVRLKKYFVKLWFSKFLRATV